MREIPLTQGYVAIVDDDDYDLVSQYKWHASVARKQPSIIYAHREYFRDGQRVKVKMHRLITGAVTGIQVDHVDHDGLNNTRANLRLATPSQNQANQRLRLDSTSGVKGVSVDTKTSVFAPWRARLQVDGKRYHLGSFKTKEEAGAAYLKAAYSFFGDFAHVQA